MYGFTFLLGSLFCFEGYFKRDEIFWLLFSVNRAPYNTVLLALSSALLPWQKESCCTVPWRLRTVGSKTFKVHLKQNPDTQQYTIYNGKPLNWINRFNVNEVFICSSGTKLLISSNILILSILYI